MVCFKILLEVLSSLRPLTFKLQMEALVVHYAYSQMKSIIATLKKMKENSKLEFKRIFEETTSQAREIHGKGFDLEQPRINQQQMHRVNIQTTTAEEYYRTSLYNEFLLHVVVELEEQFVTIPSRALES